ncbi:RuBisCO large subunit C-terminal-like domain-containing protein [Planktotalea sp.]|uniref:RuBisCO large subunit C-terminal-like domain-containing protein n=1 Tax=Planktotalea sp. TaxID=2029877 RepID=UPI0025E59064|nr:RuBisCO large subunit C-terminal-like domain-containing protein [Planktotalea sp.]
MSHPDGPGAGIISSRQAAAAQKAGEQVEDYAKDLPELAAALATFRRAVNRS